MKLMFKKTEEGQISVNFKDGDKYTDFSYSEMVRRIYEEKVIESAEIIGEFTQKERESITQLIKELKKSIMNLNQSAGEGTNDKML